MGGRAHPSLAMTPTIKFCSTAFIDYIFSSRCHTQRRMGAATRAHPSLSMTTTKTLISRDACQIYVPINTGVSTERMCTSTVRTENHASPIVVRVPRSLAVEIL